MPHPCGDAALNVAPWHLGALAAVALLAPPGDACTAVSGCVSRLSSAAHPLSSWRVCLRRPSDGGVLARRRLRTRRQGRQGRARQGRARRARAGARADTEGALSREPPRERRGPFAQPREEGGRASHCASGGAISASLGQSRPISPQVSFRDGHQAEDLDADLDAYRSGA